MKFHGLGIWKPIVAIFGGIARSAVRKMEFRTDIPSVLKGEILGGKRATPSAGRRRPTPAPSGPPPAPPPPSFMDLVTGGPDQRAGRDGVRRTSDEPRALRRLRHRRAPAVGRGHEGLASRRASSGRAATARRTSSSSRGVSTARSRTARWSSRTNRCAIARGQIRGGEFQAKTGEDGKLATALSAEGPLLRAVLGHLRGAGRNGRRARRRLDLRRHAT